MGASAARARKAAALAASLACIGTASAQATSCLLTDDDCVQQEYPKVCFDDQRNVRLQACVAWLREIEQSPSTNVHALLGLANLAETQQERVQRLRDVVAAHPAKPFYLELLASALLSIEGGELEAAALYERAYDAALYERKAQLSRNSASYGWRFARNAIWAYERAGAPERASRLRERVIADYDLPPMAKRIRSGA